MRQKARDTVRVIFALTLLGLFPATGFLRSEELQPALASAIKSPMPPETPGSPETVKKNADPSSVGPFSSLASAPDRMTGRDMGYYYLKNTFGASSLLGSGASSAIRQASNSVPEWGGGMDGYSAQYASALGRRMVRNSIEHGLSALLGSDPRYYGSGRSGIWTRSLYAAGQTLVTHTESGKARFAYEHTLGTIGSVLISRRWYPQSRRTVEEHLSSAAISFGVDAARNVIREFWPDLKNRLFR